MATGSGKTVVMAMLIAWQTLNKVASPSDARFAKRFLVVTPGITIRDRLRVLSPSDPGNYYDERDLVPADLKAGCAGADRDHELPRLPATDAKEIQGVAETTRRSSSRASTEDPFKETDAGNGLAGCCAASVSAPGASRARSS